MNVAARKIMDRSFTCLGALSIGLLAGALLTILAPIVIRGAGAVVFRGTCEYRRLMLEEFGRGDRGGILAELRRVRAARRPVYDMVTAYERELALGRKALQGAASRLRVERRRIGELPASRRSIARRALRVERGLLRGKEEAARRKGDLLSGLKADLATLLGPMPGERRPALLRDQYGQTRWDGALAKLDNLLYEETYAFDQPGRMGRKELRPRADDFRGSPVEPLFDYVRKNLKSMLLPQWTFYWRFFFDKSLDSHFFGGVWPEMLGTFYLSIGAMLFAAPMGVIAAIYLVEYAGENWGIGALRAFISALAGVPSIVFGLFGLAFFINTVHVSESKSVLAGSLTLALLALPVIIRASEEAIRSVPGAYKEAALSLGAGKWRTVVTVILPAALPGILTGVIISMGRVAGETAPIIFTAAVSMGSALSPAEVFTQPTPALPWNIYNLATEHQKVDEIRHVQYGMVLALIMLALGLNIAAIWLRARISRRLKG